MSLRYKITASGPGGGRVAWSRFRCVAIARAKVWRMTTRNVEVVDTRSEKTIWPEDTRWS